MKKQIKKIGALVLAGVLALGMSMTTLAAGDGSDSLGAGNTVSIKDKLIAFNPDETSIYAPAVTFSYTIVAGSGGDTVTDADDISAVVLAGDWSGTDGSGNSIAVSGTPTITGSNSYSLSDTLKAASDGDNTNEKDISVSFESVTFPKPGIYRYTITRTITDTNGVLESTADITRSLDVYVKEESGTCSIYGYILHDISGDIGKESTTKYDHYESEYKTSNLTVGKTLINDSMMNGHKFPFSVTFENAKGAHIMVDAEKGGTGKATAPALDAGVVLSEPTIANEGIVKYIGIPNGFTATVFETNDVTGTSYKSQYSLDGATLTGDKVISWTGEAAKSNSASTEAATDKTKTVGFTNTLAIISPTGVALRFAPYAVLFAAGLVLLFVFRRRDTEED